MLAFVRAFQDAPSKWSTTPRDPPAGKAFPVVSHTPRAFTTARCVPFTSGPSERNASHALAPGLSRAAPPKVPAQSAPSGPTVSDETRGFGRPGGEATQPEGGA